MNEDQFRRNVYETLQAVKSGQMSVSQAQKRIVRGARRILKSSPCPHNNQESVEKGGEMFLVCSDCGEVL